MYRDDLVSQVRASARLRGPNEARRAIAAVLDALPPALAGPLAGWRPDRPQARSAAPESQPAGVQPTGRPVTEPPSGPSAAGSPPGLPVAASPSGPPINGLPSGLPAAGSPSGESGVGPLLVAGSPSGESGVGPLLVAGSPSGPLVAGSPSGLPAAGSPSGQPVAGSLPARLADVPVDGSGDLIRSVAARLHIDEPNAAFLCRVVFSQLNAAPHGTTPAQLAHLAPAGIRPLLRARPEDPAPKVLARLGPLRPLGISAEKSPGVVSIRGRAVRPVGEKVEGTWS